MLCKSRDHTCLDHDKESAIEAWRVVNERFTTGPQDDSTYNAAMSTLMRTLRNLRQIGFKV
jgi:hypothetical protein